MPSFVGWNGYYQAIGRERAGQIVGAVIYTNASPRNVVTSIVLEEPMTRRFLYAVFWYPFEQLKVARLTATVEEWNAKSLLFCKHVGFRVEGRMVEAASDGGDVIVMGLLKRNCRFLKRPP